MTFHVCISVLLTNTLTLLITYWLHKQKTCDLESHIDDIEKRLSQLEVNAKNHSHIEDKLQEFIESNYDIID